MKKIRVVVVILGIVLVAYILYERLIFTLKVTSGTNLSVKNIKIEFDSTSFYFNIINGGRANGYERIYLSKDCDLQPINRSKAYEFYTSELFYKIEKDTLKLLVLEPYRTPKINLSPKIKVLRINNYSISLYYRKNLSKLGLKLICTN